MSTDAKPDRKCLNCRWFALASEKMLWGDCAHDGLKLPLERKQHRDNGKSCPCFEVRDEIKKPE